jgi:DNA invertase Pin-like site-specific DNA recombinase
MVSNAILVYDVSRWGRFQDVDESAYYEYRCRRASIDLHYCAKSFSNDGSVFAALVKTLKRTMAAEYSRELSAKVFAGQSRLTEMGYRQGGTAGYGFRRLLVDQDGNPKFVLHTSEVPTCRAFGQLDCCPSGYSVMVVVHTASLLSGFFTADLTS